MKKLLLMLVAILLTAACELRPGANGTIIACDWEEMNVNGQLSQVEVCRDTGVPNSVAGW